MTLQTAVNIIKELSHKGDVGNTSDDVTQQIYDCINLCRRDVVTRLPKRYLRKTDVINIVKGTTSYTLASDVQKPVLFRYTVDSTERFLTKVDSEQEFYRHVYSASATQADPTEYFEAGVDSSVNQQIIVSPTPSTARTLNYTYLKTWAVDELGSAQLTSNIPQIPIHLHNIIVKGGLAYFLQMYSDPQLQLFMRQYRDDLDFMDSYENESTDEARQWRLYPLKLKTF